PERRGESRKKAHSTHRHPMLASDTRPETKSRVGFLADLDERVVAAQRAAEHGEPGLLADRLDHENAVGVREIDPGSRAPALEGSPDRLGHLALERWRVELAFETPALEADEEGAAGEAVEERLGGVDERRDGRARLDAYGLLDRQQLGEHARQEGIARERGPHPVQPGRDRRIGSDLAGEPRGGGEMIARRHDLVHEAERKRLRSRDHAARHDELLRLRIADGADEPGRAAHVGDETEPDLGQAELAVAGRDPQVERERELESESGHVAMEGADDGLLDRLEARQRRLHLAYDRAEGRARLALDVGREHAEIDASREHPPLAVDDHGPYIPVALGGGHRVDEGKEHLAVDGVPLLGPVEADVEDRVLAARDDEGAAHGA